LVPHLVSKHSRAAETALSMSSSEAVVICDWHGMVRGQRFGTYGG
jgi:hypothetical protein